MFGVNHRTVDFKIYIFNNSLTMLQYIDIELRLKEPNTDDYNVSAKVSLALFRCPWRWGNTCSHSEHRSQAQ